MYTICHNNIGDSSKKKLYYYENSGLFQCYTSCGSFDIFELVIQAKKIQDFQELQLYDAIKYVANFFSIAPSFIDNHQNRLEDLKILANYELLNRTKDTIDIKYIPYDDNILNNLAFIPSIDWMREGITINTMKKYGIKYYGTEHKIVIPHFNYYNELIGIRSRTLVESDAERYGKYMPIRLNKVLYTHPLSYSLYGLNFNLENIRQMKKIIIFESEKSVMLYDSLFGSDNNISVATCGSSISSIQIDLIKDICNVDEVIIAYDKEFEEIGDDNFHKDVKHLNMLAQKVAKYFTVSIMFDKFKKLNYKDSPIDQGKDTFEFLFQNRITREVGK